MNPAIALRTSTEIKEEVLNPGQHRKILEKIYEGKTMQMVLSWQSTDGYFSNRMHTPVSNRKIWSHEGCVRYLLEMGLTNKEEPLRKAMNALLKPDWGRELTAIKSVAAEEFGYEVIRAALFAQAGLHEHDFVKHWIDASLKAFQCMDEAESHLDLLDTYRDKYIFKGGKSLPNIYNMRILAYTTSWRNKTNIEIVQRAYQKLYQWLPLPSIYIKAKSQLVAPAFTIAQAYNKDFNNEEAYLWLQFYELSARMGVLTTRTPFYNHFNSLVDSIMLNGEEILDKVDKRGFFSYSGYSGMALEDDWRNKERKRDDLMFRIKLIDAITKKDQT